MCARSEGKLGDLDVDVYMGYYGGSISVNKHKERVYEFKVQMEEISNKEECIEYFSKFSSVELATLIAELIENADE